MAHEKELLSHRPVGCPVAIAGNEVPYDDRFDALNAMCRRIDTSEFDVALMGACAYGLPLAAHVKRRGQQAIHAGGVTQLLFGIFGERWIDGHVD